ncbi:MAG: hypothetical protein M1319_01425 [Chloroflexi bacterium]|nr:hypothetical protein [Chloroflexota bacterium]
MQRLIVVLTSFLLVTILAACGSVAGSNTTPAPSGTPANSATALTSATPATSPTRKASPSSVSDADLLNPIDGFMRAAATGDAETAWHWRTEETSNVSSYDTFAAMIKRLSYLFDGYQSVAMKQKAVVTDATGKPAFNFTAITKYADGTQGTFKAIIRQEVDGWKIVSMDIEADPSRVEKAGQLSGSAGGSATPSIGGVSSTDLGNGWKRYQVAGATIDLPSSYMVIPGRLGGDVSSACLLTGIFQDGQVHGGFFLTQSSGPKSGGDVGKETIKLPAGDADKWVISQNINGTAWAGAQYELMQGSEKWSISVQATSQTGTIDEAKYQAEFDKIAQSLVLPK